MNQLDGEIFSAAGFKSHNSYIKLIEYGITKIPFVATDYGPYAQYVRENKIGQVGFLADNNSQWKRALKSLIEDKSLREKIANNNYKNVIEYHTVNKGISQWVDALKTNANPQLEAKRSSFMPNQFRSTFF